MPNSFNTSHPETQKNTMIPQVNAKNFDATFSGFSSLYAINIDNITLILSLLIGKVRDWATDL